MVPERRMGIFCRTERSMVRSMCGVQLEGRKRTKDLILMVASNETIDHMAMANSAPWYRHMLRREDDHVVRRALDFEIEGQEKKELPRRILEFQVEEKSVKVGLRREDVLCRSKWSVGIYQIAASLR